MAIGPKLYVWVDLDVFRLSRNGCKDLVVTKAQRFRQIGEFWFYGPKGAS